MACEGCCRCDRRAGPGSTGHPVTWYQRPPSRYQSRLHHGGFGFSCCVITAGLGFAACDGGPESDPLVMGALQILGALGLTTSFGDLFVFERFSGWRGCRGAVFAMSPSHICSDLGGELVFGRGAGQWSSFM